MRLFSILQTAFLFRFNFAPDAPTYGLEFSEDPNDSSLTRLRAVASDQSDAVEIEFDRNGRERSRRLWPMKYPAWDRRDPAVIEKQIAKQEQDALDADVAAETERADAIDNTAAKAEAPATKAGKKARA